MEPQPQGRGRPGFQPGRLSTDARLRREVEAAVRLGISPSRYAGEEPAEVTEYEYNKSGRLVRSVTTRSPEWTNEDRSLVKAFLEYEALTCRGCGGFIPETTDPGNEGKYEADLPHRCHRCDALGKQQEAYADAPQRSALMFWPVHLKE
ncbi:hypothetical protein ACFPN7_01585 [Amycolatopsis halotolerans]|uniref:hypothetical protein n=1 Tax=Amycolatopsis halotolerans TaxID=330083 RepID=UPI003610F6BE